MDLDVLVYRRDLAEDGFRVVPGALTPDEVARWEMAADAALRGRAARRRREAYAVRNLFQAAPALAAECASLALVALAEAALGPGSFVVRAILFDKSPRANWGVAWHQDLAIAVRERGEAPGFGPWSVKAGVPHVEPPVPVLARMLTLRVHLDDTDGENGALRVLPGSHRLGRLSHDELEAARARIPERECAVPAGGVLAMRPLLLHASSPARADRRRRVVHLELAAEELPPPLAWLQRVPVRSG